MTEGSGWKGSPSVAAKRVMSPWSPSAPPPPPDLRAVSENGANGAGRSCHHWREGLREGQVWVVERGLQPGSTVAT